MSPQQVGPRPHLRAAPNANKQLAPPASKPAPLAPLHLLHGHQRKQQQQQQQPL